MREVRFDTEYEVTDATGAQTNEKTIQGITEKGLVGVRIDFIAYDAGVGAGTPVTKGRFKALPVQQRALFGGDTWHTFATLDTYKQNRIFFGNVLHPGEDLLIQTQLRTLAATAAIRVGRTLLFAD